MKLEYENIDIHKGQSSKFSFSLSPRVLLSGLALMGGFGKFIYEVAQVYL